MIIFIEINTLFVLKRHFHQLLSFLRIFYLNNVIQTKHYC